MIVGMTAAKEVAIEEPIETITDEIVVETQGVIEVIEIEVVNDQGIEVETEVEIGAEITAEIAAGIDPGTAMIEEGQTQIGTEIDPAMKQPQNYRATEKKLVKWRE